MMNQWIERMIRPLFGYEQCVDRLSLSVCMGIYIAFCPFVGFHTALVFLFAWLFALNFAVMLSVSMCVNNPWTMVPVYGAGHWFGDWLLSWCAYNHYDWNPSWITCFNAWAYEVIGLRGFSFWAFMIGGNVLGIGMSIVCYPMIRRLCRYMKEQSRNKIRQTVVRSKQVAHTMVQRVQPLIIRTKQRVTQMGQHENRRTK